MCICMWVGVGVLVGDSHAASLLRTIYTSKDAKVVRDAGCLKGSGRYVAEVSCVTVEKLDDSPRVFLFRVGVHNLLGLLSGRGREGIPGLNVVDDFFLLGSSKQQLVTKDIVMTSSVLTILVGNVLSSVVYYRSKSGIVLGRKKTVGWV